MLKTAEELKQQILKVMNVEPKKEEKKEIPIIVLSEEVGSLGSS